MEKAIKDALFDWPLAPAVDRLQAQHGAITAVARELVGFMWAIARMEPMEA